MKKYIVQKDEKEKGRETIKFRSHLHMHLKQLLNFSKKLNHGEAVLMGLKSEILLSYKKKIISKKNMLEIFNHLKLIDTKLEINNFFKKKDIKKMLRFMESDKKNTSSKINIILLKDFNKAILNLQFTKKEIENFLFEQLS